MQSRVVSTLLLFITLSVNSVTTIAEENAGQSLAFDRSKGNCLACHAVPNDPAAKSPGNIAPPLVSMKSRYPDRAKLRAQIWDATAHNPDTSMPPYGKNKILTETEIDQVVDYVLKQ